MNKLGIVILIVGYLFSISGCSKQVPSPTEPINFFQVNNTATEMTKKSTPTPSFFLLETRLPGSERMDPTPDSLHSIPTLNTNPETYLVQSGDYLSRIALNFRVSVEALIQSNDIQDPNNLPVGMILNIPQRNFQEVGPDFKIIPDSELVYGPMNIWFDLKGFIDQQKGYLSEYIEEIDGIILSGTEIFSTVSKNYSVNPRLLLAILEYRSGWVTESQPHEKNTVFPLGYENRYYTGLYNQLAWAADTLNRGYYLWKANGLSDIITSDSQVVPFSPVINAGTAAVQYFFAVGDDYEQWLQDISKEGLFKEINLLFGDPFDLTIDPMVPIDLKQPEMMLPFESGQIWAFTGGPHGGWDSGSAWAALDFAPPGDAQGCVESNDWVTAVADGLIVREGKGFVIQDLDGDGFEQSGWVILYMHIGTVGRVPYGSYLLAGDRIGHPSCEGGISSGTHVHIARKFNGEWIPADGKVPFNLGGWISSGTGSVYDGYLTRNDQVVEAFNGNDTMNQIQH
ncbi:LysM peptidoglycan-binding domain-containing protein [Chloroflexota bacterium]